MAFVLHFAWYKTSVGPNHQKNAHLLYFVPIHIIMSQFKSYLLQEEQTHLGQKIGDILTALQNLNDDASNMGSRHLVRAAKGIAVQIRRILHDDWSDTEIATLKVLQRIGVALMKGIDESGDLEAIISSSLQELQQVANELQEPQNDLGDEQDSD